MPKSTKMLLEQSHITMPSAVWLHIDGVSLTTDIQPYQPPVHTYDYRTKHLQSPVQPSTPPLISPSSIVPCSITIIDGPYNNHHHHTNKQYQKLENTNMPKKFFLDRHIKKVKSLPGLIKGTALSRHTPLQSSTFPIPARINSVVSELQDDQLQMATVDNEDESLPISRTIEQQPEIRRPRVYFADFNRIQFIEENNETSPQHQTSHHHHNHRRHRRRAPKKTSNTNGINQISPSIQQAQILQNYSRPLSRQLNPPPTKELNIKKQQLLISPRVHSSRMTHLPDILNQSLPIELPSTENSNGKYILQREKPFIRLPKPIMEIPAARFMDISSEDINQSMPHPSPVEDSHIQTHGSECSETNNGMLLHNNPSMNRHRPTLRTISLRQQFLSPGKLKTITVTPTTNNTYHQQLNTSLLNTRRSYSLNHSNSLNYSISQMHDDNEERYSDNEPLVTTENRPITSTRSVKQLTRSDANHFNSKNPFGGNTTNDSTKPHAHELTPRFRNLLTIVRAPYGAGSATSSNIPSIPPTDFTLQPMNQNPPMINARSTRSKSARPAPGSHPTSNTIFV